MIYRKRENKTSYECRVTPKGNFLKIAMGKRVWYFELWSVFHNLVSIKDYGCETLITHARKRSRVTVDRGEVIYIDFEELLAKIM